MVKGRAAIGADHCICEGEGEGGEGEGRGGERKGGDTDIQSSAILAHHWLLTQRGQAF